MMRHLIARTVPSRDRHTAAAASAVLLATIVSGTAQAQPDLSSVEEQIVIVRAFDPLNIALGDISGLAVGGGLVVTNAQMLQRAETIVVIRGGGQEHSAALRSFDDRSGVAILDAEGLEIAGPTFALDDPDADPDEGDLTYVPRLAVDGSLDADPAPGLISEVRRLDPVLQGERALLLYRHNARVGNREYGMPMLNGCGEVTGLIRPDPDMSLRDLNDRVGPRESTFGVAGAELRRALADVGAAVETAATACPDAGDTLAVLEGEAQEARDAAAEAAADAAAAREQADAAEERAARLEADAEASQGERDAAREEAEQLRAAANEQEAELDDLEQRAEAARSTAQEAQQRVQALQRRERMLYGALAVAAAVLLAIGIGAWAVLRKRRRELDQADQERREAEEQRRRSEEELAEAVKPASFSCLLEGADDAGRGVVIKIDAAQLGSPEGVVVGRNPARAGVLLDHQEASREHFRLVARDDDLFIEDLESTNGTYVNGAELQPGQNVRLENGDEIRIGAAISVRVTVNPNTP